MASSPDHWSGKQINLLVYMMLAVIVNVLKKHEFAVNLLDFTTAYIPPQHIYIPYAFYKFLLKAFCIWKYHSKISGWFSDFKTLESIFPLLP